tara:strand:+ start:2309 stop:2680 length:372 start_codon:yes stop_codon:yes gene_type:complete
MSWFDIIKMMTPREFLQALNLDGDIKGSVGKAGTNMSLHHDAGFVKVNQSKKGPYIVNVDGERFTDYSLSKILPQVKDQVKKSQTSYTDVLLREAGAVSTATPSIINVRYSKKKEDEKDAVTE